MIKKWLVYRPLEPLVGELIDDGTMDAISLPYDENGIAVEVAVIRTGSQLSAIRVGILSEDGKLTAEQVDVISHAQRHMLGVIKVHFDPALEMVTEPGPLSIGQFSNDAGIPELRLQFSEEPHARFFDVNAISASFEVTKQTLPQLALIADAANPVLPIQYRYLSLYKVLELEFQVAKKWDAGKWIFDRFSEEFANHDLSRRSLLSFIIDLRDRCAHIRIGDRQSLGVTGLSPKDDYETRKMLPLMFKIVSVAMDRNHGWRLTMERPNVTPSQTSVSDGSPTAA